MPEKGALHPCRIQVMRISSLNSVAVRRDLFFALIFRLILVYTIAVIALNIQPVKSEYIIQEIDR